MKRKKIDSYVGAFGYENKKTYYKIYMSKNVDLLLIGKKEKKHYVLMKNFIKIIHNHEIYRWWKQSYPYYL